MDKLMLTVIPFKYGLLSKNQVFLTSIKGYQDEDIQDER